MKRRQMRAKPGTEKITQSSTEANMFSHFHGNSFPGDSLKLVRSIYAVALLIVLLVLAQETLVAQSSRIMTRAAYEKLYFPDTLGKMEVHWLGGHTFRISALRTDKPGVRMNFPVDVVQGRYGNPLTGAKAYGFRSIFTLVDTGMYTVTRYSRLVAESGAEKDSTATWRLHIVLPNLLSPLTTDSVYFPGNHLSLPLPRGSFRKRMGTHTAYGKATPLLIPAPVRISISKDL